MNEPAFPGFDYINQDGKKNPQGMTLRDYFAAKAMLKRDWIYFVGDEETRRSLQRDAKRSYEIADAMMEARNVAQ